MHEVLEQVIGRLEAPLRPDTLPDALRILEEVLATLPLPVAPGRSDGVKAAILRGYESDLRFDVLLSGDWGDRFMTVEREGRAGRGSAWVRRPTRAARPSARAPCTNCLAAFPSPIACTRLRSSCVIVSCAGASDPPDVVVVPPVEVVPVPVVPVSVEPESAPEPEDNEEPWASATPVGGSSVAMPSGWGPSRGKTTPGWDP